MRVRSEKLAGLYDFESRFLDLGVVRYHYLDEGRGEPIVMLHGNPTWSFYYRRLVADLGNDYRVVAPDHIGCGLSDKPQDYSYTLKQHIANVERLLQHLDLKNVTLVMHDWGGAIGMGYAVRHAGNVKRFVVLNTAAFWDAHLPFLLRLARQPLLGPAAIRRLNLFARLATVLACRRERMTPEIRNGYLYPYDSYENRVAILRFVQDIPVNARHPSYGLLKEIETGLSQFTNHPMIVIWGAKDPVFTERLLDGWTRRFPAAIVKRLDGAGHYVLEDAYEQIVPWVREFLERNPL